MFMPTFKYVPGRNNGYDISTNNAPSWYFFNDYFFGLREKRGCYWDNICVE